jgi:hypothetical protein
MYLDTIKNILTGNYKIIFVAFPYLRTISCQLFFSESRAFPISGTRTEKYLANLI